MSETKLREESFVIILDAVIQAAAKFDEMHRMVENNDDNNNNNNKTITNNRVQFKCVTELPDLYFGDNDTSRTSFSVPTR